MNFKYFIFKTKRERYILKIMIALVFTFSFCAENVIFAQENQNDSLKTAQLKNYLQWSLNYGNQKKFDSVNKYLTRALTLEKELNNKELSAEVYYTFGKMKFWQANTKEAYSYLNKNLSNTIIEDSTKVKSHLLKAEILALEQRDKEAIQQAVIAQKILLTHKTLTPLDSLSIGNANLLIASIQKDANNKNQALFHFDESLKYFSSPGLKTYIKYYKAEVLKSQGNIGKSITLVKQSLKTAKKEKLDIYIPTYYYALSTYYLDLKKPDSALFYSETGLINNIDCHIDGLNNNSGLSYYHTKDYKASIASFKTALNTSFSEIPKSTIHKNLSNTYKAYGNHYKALAHFELYAKYQDSINNVNTKRELFEISEKYQSEKKSLTIDMLEIKDQSNQEVISKQKWMIILVSISLMLTFLLIGVITKYYLKQKKQRSLLFNKNRELIYELKWGDEQNEDDTKIQKKTSTTIDIQKRNSIIKKIEKEIYNKFFLNNNTTLITFAKEINTNTTYLSKIINDKFHKSFTHFINDLRIQYLLQKIENEERYRAFTIDYISDDIGFSSSSAFYGAFKKYTGLTPSYYIKKSEWIKK